MIDFIAEEQRRKSEGRAEQHWSHTGVTLESRWSCTDLLDTLILNYAIKTSTFTFCPEILVNIGGSRGEGWSDNLHPTFTSALFQLSEMLMPSGETVKSETF